MKKYAIIFFTLVFSSLSLIVTANGILTCGTQWSKSVPVHLVERRVVASSQNGIVLMEVEDTFYNPTQFRCEGVYKFKMPPGAFAAGFWINTDEKEWVKGEIREIAEARKIYQTITSRLTDPGILEQKDDEITVRVFPIEREKKVGIRFRCFFSAYGDKERLVINFPIGFSTVSSADDFEGRPPEPAKAKLSFAATIFDADVIVDAMATDDLVKIKTENKLCNLSYSAETTLLNDFSISYRTGRDEKVSVATCLVPDGSKYSLIRVRNVEYAEPGRGCRIGIIVDASGSMGYRNKERALKVVKAISAMPQVKVEMYAAADGDIKRIEPADLETTKFYGATTWSGLESFPADNNLDGIVMITDGDNLQSSHVKSLWRKIGCHPVHIIYLRSDYSRSLAVMAENYGDGVFIDRNISDDQLVVTLKKSVEMLKNNPFLSLPDDRRVLPLFGSLSDVAYYVQTFNVGKFNLKTAMGEDLLSFDVGENIEPQKVSPWFASIAGRQLIRQLEGNEQTSEVIKKITELGLRYGQTTDYTAFLAVPDEVAKTNSDAMNPAYLAMFAAPNFRKARAQARDKACYANQRVILGALEMFCMDNDFKDPITGQVNTVGLGKLEHDLETGLFNIKELVDQRFLKAMPVPADNDCDYRIIGDLMKNGYVACMQHGCCDQPGVPVAELVQKYCSENNLDYDDFDFPYEVYSNSNLWSDSLEVKMQSYILLRLFLILML